MSQTEENELDVELFFSPLSLFYFLVNVGQGHYFSFPRCLFTQAEISAEEGEVKETAPDDSLQEPPGNPLSVTLQDPPGPL